MQGETNSPQTTYRSKRARNQIVVWFGGSFSPPVFAHREVALATYNKLFSSFPDKSIKIVFMPSNKYYIGDEACIKEKDRFHLLKLMVDDLNALGLPSVKFYIKDFEIKNGIKTKKPTPTFLSVRSLEKEFKVRAANIYLIMRQSHFESLLQKEWKQPITLLERYNFIILPSDLSIIYQSEAENRLLGGFVQEASSLGVDESPEGVPLRSRIILVDAGGGALSRGIAARRAAYNSSINLSTITVEPVAKYIREHGLYKSKACIQTRNRRTPSLSTTRKRKLNANN